jgi:hypothetical protein
MYPWSLVPEIVHSMFESQPFCGFQDREVDRLLSMENALSVFKTADES